MTLDKKALVELAKTFGRFMWFGLLGLVSTFLVSLAADSNLLQSTWTVMNVTIPVGVYIVAGIGFLAKAIDRYIHKSRNTDLKGIAPGFLQQ